MSHQAPFVGRESQLKEMTLLLKKKSASLVTLTGRRRIGKSRLVQEFSRDHRFFEFSGLAPAEDVTPEIQLQRFMYAIGSFFGLGNLSANNWSEAFGLLANQLSHINNQSIVVLFDEISWMAAKSPTFSSDLKNAWDMSFKHLPNLMLVLCGSVSTWLEENIIKSTAFFGRVSLQLHLKELRLESSVKLLRKFGFNHYSAYDICKLLGVTGGVPRYLEELQSSLTPEANIHRLAFKPSGILYNEFDHIFHDLFGRRGELYKRIVLILSSGASTLAQIAQKIGQSESSYLLNCLDELDKSGFIKRDYTWPIANKRIGKQSVFRLSDNYLRFYLKCILPKQVQIDAERFEMRSLHDLPGWDTVMGLQFENIVLNNRDDIICAMGISPNDVLIDNPYFQNKQTRQEACQIDYMVQTRLGTLYVCEVKYARRPIQASVADEVEEKIKRLKRPKNISVVPVLIYLGELSPSLEERGYFIHKIDIEDLIRD